MSRTEDMPSTVTIPLKDFPERIRAGEDFEDLHQARMSQEDWLTYDTMTAEDRASFENVIGQLRTGLENRGNRNWLEKKRAEILGKYK